MRRHPGRQRTDRRRAQRRGHGAGHPARGERLRRRPHRDHGPVGLAAGRRGPGRVPRLPRPERPAGAVRRRGRRPGAAGDRHQGLALARRRRLRGPARVLRAGRRGARRPGAARRRGRRISRRPPGCWTRKRSAGSGTSSPRTTACCRPWNSSRAPGPQAIGALLDASPRLDAGRLRNLLPRTGPRRGHRPRRAAPSAPG